MQAPKTERKPRELLSAGTYLARLYSIIELGTESYLWKGVETKSHKVRLTWELPTEMRVFDEAKGEQPKVISAEYGFSMAPKARLRNEVVQGMIGTALTDTEADGFDIDSLLGKECLLGISHKPSKNDPDIKYEEISSISTLMKGQTCPAQINPTVTLYFSNWKPEVFEKLPQFIKDKIVKSPEYQSTIAVGSSSAGVSKKVEEEINPKDIPF